VDTGLGGKADRRFEEMFSIDRSPTLYASLKGHGVSPEDVHLVINTHLHFDHAGGNTVGTNGDLRAAFPNARYIVQRGEYDDALRANERTRASYRPENITPPKLSKHWDLVEGETELVSGVSLVLTAGHTRHHQSVKVESEGRVALFLGDVIPTVSHLPLPYIMGYDLYPLQTLETKRWLLQTACDERWLFVFEHDPRVQMGYVCRDVEGKYYLKPFGGGAA
jgi:glyoxylase-like metal-dependent hydrolase (beta-lactamase superfamily II)